MTTRRYILTSGATLVFVAVLMYAGTSLAQVNNAPSCSSTMQNVNVNQTAVFTASGGNGSYVWSANSFSSMGDSSGSQFLVSFPSSGTNTVQVRSNGQTSTCSITVLPATSSDSNFVSNSSSSGTLECLPSSQSVAAGQTASLTATGGNGSYFWNIPELSLNNPTGTGSYVTYVTPGTRTVTVTSGGASATCDINVIGTAVTPVVTVPGLPNTGGGYGKW
jgi:hypothetical protein